MKPCCWSTKDAAEILGLSTTALARLVEAGIVDPLYRSPPRARGHRFDLPDLVGVALMQNLRKCGFDAGLAARVCRWVSQKTIDELREQFANGEHVLLAAGIADPFPRLLSPESMFANPAIDIPAAMQAGITVCAVDVRAALEQIEARLVANPVRPAEAVASCN
ncbi:MAG: hypothetical protein SH850_25835 [Planctomycetaceae bacterium]|nr:hypothetical protein [Planctomycetaceae bacterium]